MGIYTGKTPKDGWNKKHSLNLNYDRIKLQLGFYGLERDVDYIWEEDKKSEELIFIRRKYDEHKKTIVEQRMKAVVDPDKMTIFMFIGYIKNGKFLYRPFLEKDGSHKCFPSADAWHNVAKFIAN